MFKKLCIKKCIKIPDCFYSLKCFFVITSLHCFCQFQSKMFKIMISLKRKKPCKCWHIVQQCVLFQQPEFKRNWIHILYIFSTGISKLKKILKPRTKTNMRLITRFGLMQKLSFFFFFYVGTRLCTLVTQQQRILWLLDLTSGSLAL